MAQTNPKAYIPLPESSREKPYLLGCVFPIHGIIGRLTTGFNRKGQPSFLGQKGAMGQPSGIFPRRRERVAGDEVGVIVVDSTKNQGFVEIRLVVGRI